MKPQTVFDLIKIAGYHNDSKEFTRLYCENRISFSRAGEAFRAGKTARANGVKCSCRECSK